MLGALCNLRMAVCDVCDVEHSQVGGQTYNALRAGQQKEAYRSILKYVKAAMWNDCSPFSLWSLDGGNATNDGLLAAVKPVWNMHKVLPELHERGQYLCVQDWNMVNERVCFPGACPIPGNYTQDECATQCDSHSGCEVYVYFNQERLCFLKSDIGDMTDILSNGTGIVGCVRSSEAARMALGMDIGLP